MAFDGGVVCDEFGYPVHLPGYRIRKSLVDRPGMGHVVLAEQESKGRKVALKMIRPAIAGDEVTIARFLREARTLRGLRHEHIVRVFDVGYGSGVLYFAMEYVPLGDLANFLELRSRPVAPGRPSP